MYAFQGASVLTIILLVVSALVPTIVLFFITYKFDRLEKEPPRLLRNLLLFGLLSALIAMILGTGALNLIDIIFIKHKTHFMYHVIYYFGVVAYTEETSKYIVLKKLTWNQTSFNSRFDGILYAVCVSLGFAALENVLYVLVYGFKTALVRALISVPVHACCAVFMGIFYSLAKQYDYEGKEDKSTLFRIIALCLSALMHGAFDYIATRDDLSIYYLIGFIGILFISSLVIVIRTSRRDRFID